MTTCTHIKTNGSICQGVAMEGKEYCYFHLRDRQRYSNLRRAHNYRLERLRKGYTPAEIYPLNARNSPENLDMQSAHLFGTLELPVLEDAAAIQIAVSNIFRALALQQLDRHTAAVLLYSLQIASGNLKNLQTQPLAEEPAASKEPHPLDTFAPGLLEEDKLEAQAAPASTPAIDDDENVYNDKTVDPARFFCGPEKPEPTDAEINDISQPTGNS
ncbi:MAG: hypothetical protein JWO13_1652 [Acidobacteriales bacterium]|nr:hypothetical protein [Terriglobales bacterium]